MNPLLTPPQPPRLPDPSAQVDSRYVNALLSALRLFFNQLQRVVALLTGPNGGQYVQCPSGVFSSATTQTVAANTAVSVDLEVVELANGVAVVSSTQLVPTFTGQYRVSAQLHFANAGAAEAVSLWLRIDGVDVVDTCADVMVPTGGGNVCVEWPLLIVGQEVVTLQWSTPTGNASLAAVAARTTPVRPAMPSARVSVLLVSAALNE